jgi:ketosteroid isomerase-like protein
MSLDLLTPETVEAVKRDDPRVMAELREAFDRIYDPEVLILNARGVPVSQRPYRGWEGFVAWIRDTFDVLDGCGIEVERTERVGDNFVSSVRVTGNLRLTGIRGDFGWTVVAFMRDGRIVRGQAFLDEADALEAARG